jgi:hypothetical protein
MIYYRVAFRGGRCPNWQWKSTMLTSLNNVFTFLRVYMPSGGIILLDAGAIVHDPDGNISLEGGKHQYIDSQVDQLCAALS